MKPIKIIHKIYSTFWKIFKPQTVGIRAILVENGKVLLVKHTYQNSWYLPGGGLKNNETFEQGIKRELHEELGITVENLKLHGVYNNFFEGKSDSIIVFSSTHFSQPNKKDKEIEQYNFFEISNLPQNISPGTRKRIEEYLSDNFSKYSLW